MTGFFDLAFFKAYLYYRIHQYISFYGWNNVSLYGYTIVGLFISWWLSGLFPIFWAYMNNVATMSLYKFLYGHMSLLLLREALYGNSILAI